jgi:hypothetical protein
MTDQSVLMTRFSKALPRAQKRIGRQHQSRSRGGRTRASRRLYAGSCWRAQRDQRNVL